MNLSTEKRQEKKQTEAREKGSHLFFLLYDCELFLIMQILLISYAIKTKCQTKLSKEEFMTLELKRFLIPFLILFSFGSPLASAKIELRDHQSYPGDFLYERKNQKGLLIYHGLGTGKTYLSLAFTEKYPNKKVIILLPRFLKSNWEIQMKSYGIKDRSRYKLVSFRDSSSLLKYNFEDNIVIIDEVHKLIDLITSSQGISNQDYGKLYFKLKKAHKILALTGTPIYNSSFDIAYIANLVSGKNLLSFNPEKFKEKYTKVNTGKSLFRGYFTESKLMITFFPIAIAVTLSPLLFVGGAFAMIPFAGFLGASTGFFVNNEIFPAETVEFRSFDSEKLSEFTQNYVSFHEVSLKNKEFYPRKRVHEKSVNYNSPQTNFFLEFVDEALGPEPLKTLLLDSPEGELSSEYLALNSVNIQKKFLQNPTVGREIGNFPFYVPKATKNGLFEVYRTDKKKIQPQYESNFVESKKFEEIYWHLNNKKGQVALYSNYYHNGILQFAQFLDRKGMKNYEILSPELSVKEQVKVIENYNNGKTRIILLHPEITEGVSLQATEQFHILEPLANIALQEQVIGRAVRFKSHERLPENRREVNVYLWRSKISYCSFWLLGCIIPTEAAFIKREHWQRRFSEINPSGWTHGIDFVDQNHQRKNQTPDIRVEKGSHMVEAEMKSFKKVARHNSIESIRHKRKG